MLTADNQSIRTVNEKERYTNEQRERARAFQDSIGSVYEQQLRSKHDLQKSYDASSKDQALGSVQQQRLSEERNIKEQQTAVLGGQGSGEQGNHHKTDDLSAAVFYCVKGAPLHAVRAVAGCDIWIASCQNSVLVTCHVGIAGFQTVRVVKAQSVFITDEDDIDIWYIQRKRIQVAGHGGIRIAVFQHGGDIRNCSNIRSSTADQLVHILSLPGNIKKQSKTK